jgi:hypothetical protein
MQCYEGMQEVYAAMQQIQKLRSQLAARRQAAGGNGLTEGLSALDQKLGSLAGTAMGRRGRRGGGGEATSLSRLHGELNGLLGLLEGADAAPTTQAVQACQQALRTLAEFRKRWQTVLSDDVKTLNEKLQAAKLAPLTLGGP